LASFLDAFQGMAVGLKDVVVTELSEMLLWEKSVASLTT
jgi:hypothetical protein